MRVEKVNYAKPSRLNDKRFGVQPFFQRAGGVQRQRLWSSIAMDEIPYAERARQGVNWENSPADCFSKRGRPASEAAP